MISKYTSEDVLTFLAETLQDIPQETSHSSALAALRESYNEFAESILLPSSFPDKHNVQQRTRTVFEQMEFLSFFPDIIDEPFHCLIGFSTKERLSLLGKQTPALSDIVAQNQSIPTFFTRKNSPAFVISWHGHKQFLGNFEIPSLLDSIFSHRIELRRLFCALSIHIEHAYTAGIIADFPKYALPDSKFLVSSIHLADTVIISLCNNKNKQLVHEAFTALKNKNRRTIVLTIGNFQAVPKDCLHLITKQYNTVEEINISSHDFYGKTTSISDSLMSSLLCFPAWIAQQEKVLHNRICDLTSGIVLIDENNIDISASLLKLRECLSSQRKYYTDIKKRVDNFIEVIWNAGRTFEDTLKVNPDNTKKAECATGHHFKRSFSDQEECFLQLVRAGETRKAQNLFHTMRDAGYEHALVLSLYLAELSGSALPDKSLSYLAGYTDSNPFLLRAIVHFRKALHVQDEVAGAITQSFSRQSADEFYVHGTWLLKQFEKKEEGLRELRTSLSMGSTKAGEILLKMWGNDIKTLRFLAKYHIAEANYILGKGMIHSSNHTTKIRGWTELKIAAALGNWAAMEEIANYEYWIVINARLSEKRGETISQEEKERACRASNNAKLLYERIVSNNTASFKSISNYGELLYNERDFIGALNILKDCPEARAQMCCGRMYEYGEGVAQDLRLAKKHYQKAANAGDKVAPKRLTSVTEKIQKNMKQKQTSTSQGYGSREESRSSTTTSSGWCFITTATCLALDKPDNCKELTVFRYFRDNYIAHTLKGNQLIDEYYSIAPKIVSKINSLKNSKEIYNYIWNTYLQHIYMCIIKSNNKKAIELYTKMVRRLQYMYS